MVSLLLLSLLHVGDGAFHGNLIHPHLTHAFEAKWHGNVIAIARVEDVFNVEGMYFFPQQSINREFFRPSETTYKDRFGKANCYTLHEAHPIHGTHVKFQEDAAITYLNPKEKYSHVKGRITFHKGVTIHHIEVNADFIRHHEEYPESELNGRSMENVEIDEATGESKMDL